MKSTSLFAATALFLTSQAQLLVPFHTNDQPVTQPEDQIDHPKQHPMDNNAPGIQLPSNPSKDDERKPTGDIILSDVLGTNRQINIFAQFTRDIESIHSRLDSSSKNTTVLAPSNSAIAVLPRKPWEDPKDYGMLGAVAYQGKAGEDRAQRNIRRFAEAHIVPVSPWKEGEKVETLGGSEVWWEQGDGGKKVIKPGGVVVDSIGSRVANGEVWVLDACLNYGQ